ncbi:CyP450 monooxygenase [Trametes meyenii]|nr:CyP450 monooxygenase [Trametes meyenii]
MPTRKMPEVFRDMNRRYGDVVYLSAFGQSMLVLGTHEAAIELLEKRSAKYADKVHSTMAKLTGWDWALPIMTYGPWWRKSRKAFHEFYNPAVIEKYRPIQLETARRFLLRLLKDPQHFPEHVRYGFGASIIRVAYGIDIDAESTPYLSIASETMATFAATFVPGKYLVETFPILRFLPPWFPGAQFRRDSEKWRPVVQRLRDVPWNATTKAAREGVARPSIATTMVERLAGFKEDEALAEESLLAQDTAATGYAGGSDTSYATMMTFFLAMAKHPSAQRRAQAELDAVVGAHRLPDFSDLPALPYVAALVKECMRWRVVLPLGIMHRAMEEDEFRGYRIPKGTLVIPNVWAYTRDARHYPDPEEFRPERYLRDGKLDPDVLDPRDVIFGFGRRACPGRDFAEATFFTLMASVLHVFDIKPATDELANPVPLPGKMSEGVLS